MAFALQNSTIEEQRSVIRFLTAEGRESVGDDQRPGLANTSDLIDKVDDLVRSDRRVTLRILALKVDVSYGTVWTIVDRMRFWKVCAAWVPKQLTDQQKKLRMGLALQHLFWYQEDLAFRKRIVTEMLSLTFVSGGSILINKARGKEADMINEISLTGICYKKTGSLFSILTNSR
ncbi:hypothetical protein TNIN_449671 [Trichonephila inaurata madagascariensis]|uniref:Transposase n=1 Tax=Trichonephila inaurata madagascariensis TaxID=2747483 RepID=A0A8X6I583_9ARAC|nr:hypothetical protein TNIN_449671 [Trichonephila inaurata madagascariensis]